MAKPSAIFMCKSYMKRIDFREPSVIVNITSCKILKSLVAFFTDASS